MKKAVTFLHLVVWFLLFHGTLLCAQSLVLKDLFTQAVSGDYVVFSQEEMYVLWRVHDFQNGLLTIEEISVPSYLRKGSCVSWKDWVKGGAQGNTSWLMYEFDLSCGHVRELYSFTRESWLDPSFIEGFLARLMEIPFSPVPDIYRKRLGRSLEGSKHKRGLWHPPLIVNGCRQEGALFTSFEGVWPKDGSEMANKKIEIYLPDGEGPFPKYFPYWINFSNRFKQVSLFVVDSGQEMLSLKMYLPRPRPEFISQPKKVKETIEFVLRSPLYFKDYFIFLQSSKGSSSDKTQPLYKKEIKPQNESGTCEVIIDLEGLDIREGSYKILVVPKGFGDVFSESKPFNI